MRHSVGQAIRLFTSFFIKKKLFAIETTIFIFTAQLRLKRHGNYFHRIFFTQIRFEKYAKQRFRLFITLYY